MRFLDKLLKSKGEETSSYIEKLKQDREYLKFLKDKEDILKLAFKYPEYLDVFKINIHGSQKYEDENWLKSDGKGMSIKDNYASISRHSAQYYAREKVDIESGLDHRLHAACRLLMSYTRSKRHLVHPEDFIENIPYIESLDDSKCLTIEQAAERYAGKSNYYIDEKKDLGRKVDISLKKLNPDLDKALNIVLKESKRKKK